MTYVGGVTDLRVFDAGRTLGVHVQAEQGGAKSVLLAQALAFPDAVRRIPTVAWDMKGDLIHAHLAMVLAQPTRVALDLLERTRYVDIGNPTYAYGLPMYYALPGDDAYAIAQRPLDAFIKLSPALSEASILGESSLRQIGTAVGMLMTTMADGHGGTWQVTEALDLLLHYTDPLWKAIMSNAEPAVPQAVRFFKDSYGQWDREQQRLRRWSFESRIWGYVTSRSLRAIIGQSRFGLNWDEVVEKGLTVLLDFHRVQNSHIRDELAVLYMQSLTEHIERRGFYQRKPLSLIFDEVPALLENPALEPDVMRLATRYRSLRVWPTIAHQAMSQLSPRLRESIWSFGNQIIGKQLNLEACEEIVRNLFPLDPYRIKMPAQSVGQMPQTMPLSEQEREMAMWLQRLSGRQFLVRRYYDEQTPDPVLRFIGRTPEITALRTVSPDRIEQAKEENLRQFARSVDDVLREIDARLPGRVAPQQERPKL